MILAKLQELLRGKAKKWWPLAISVFLAIGVHLFLVMSSVLPTAWRFWSARLYRPALPAHTPISLVSIDPSQFEKNRQTNEIRKPEKQEKEKPKQKPPRPRGQVVELAPSLDKKPPDSTHLLSQHNTHVKEQTIARIQRFEDQVAPKISDAKSVPKKKAQAAQAEKPDPSKAQNESQKTRVEPLVSDQQGTLSDESTLVSDLSDARQLPDQDHAGALKQGELETHEQSSALLEKGKEQQTVAVAPVPDRVEGVKPGDATWLNSRAFKYATFFNRIKRSVVQYWYPKLRMESRYRNARDLRAILNVVLDQRGALVTAKLVYSSGEQYFDDVAIRSFQQASPFPNPPRSLVEADGHIQFFFGFFSTYDRLATQAFRSRR